MKLEDVDGDLLRSATAVFLEEAYGSARPKATKRPLPDLTDARDSESVVALMDDESRRYGGAAQCRRWVLRLGNSRYPNMKLVLEESLLAGEFVFSVDTHDDAVVSPGDPDEPLWKEIRHWNLAVKKRIETRWRKSKIPTNSTLKSMLRRRSRRRKRTGPPKAYILVVDDERDIADAVEAVLTAEGYEVRIANDGEEALAAVRSRRPDLVLMDYEMPGMTGAEVCARLRKRKRTVPILLATAAMIDLSTIADADGFLVKPYQRDVLLSFVSHLAAPNGR
ncbi:MAG: response regulator transcription factor [Planctomycetota bacterium]